MGADSRTGMFGMPGCQSSVAAYCGSSSLRVVSYETEPTMPPFSPLLATYFCTPQSSVPDRPMMGSVLTSTPEPSTVVGVGWLSAWYVTPVV